MLLLQPNSSGLISNMYYQESVSAVGYLATTNEATLQFLACELGSLEKNKLSIFWKSLVCQITIMGNALICHWGRNKSGLGLIFSKSQFIADWEAKHSLKYYLESFVRILYKEWTLYDNASPKHGL